MYVIICLFVHQHQSNNFFTILFVILVTRIYVNHRTFDKCKIQSVHRELLSSALVFAYDCKKLLVILTSSSIEPKITKISGSGHSGVAAKFLVIFVIGKRLSSYVHDLNQISLNCNKIFYWVYWDSNTSRILTRPIELMKYFSVLYVVGQTSHWLLLLPFMLTRLAMLGFAVVDAISDNLISMGTRVSVNFYRDKATGGGSGGI
uniref:Uncharacterized protein n=1 Tax=Glossina brevipalpis TaxID=37001 RepID=A0A1A9W406_9MUSC